jgi:hypothetical protein
MGEEQNKKEIKEEITHSTALVDIKDDKIQELVKYCDDDYVNQLELSESEIVDLKKSLRKTILSDNQSIPMVCSGHKCVFGDICPLVKIDKPPVGKRCSIELLLLNKWKDEYVKSLKVDWNDKIERRLVEELLELDILSSRADSLLAVEGLIMENVIGISEQTGEAIYKKEKHIALDVKNMVSTRRSKLLKEMIATREAKAKFVSDMRADPATYAARLRDKAKELRDEKIIDIDEDDIEDIDEQ